MAFLRYFDFRDAYISHDDRVNDDDSKNPYEIYIHTVYHIISWHRVLNKIELWRSLGGADYILDLGNLGRVATDWPRVYAEERAYTSMMGLDGNTSRQ